MLACLVMWHVALGFTTQKLFKFLLTFVYSVDCFGSEVVVSRSVQ